KQCYESCKTCTSKGTISDHECTECWSSNNYYPLADNLSNCYLDNENLELYFFDTDKFEKCYKSCKTCSSKGDDTDHKCLSCINDYYPLEDVNSMCLNVSPEGYYFDTNKYIKCYKSCK